MFCSSFLKQLSLSAPPPAWEWGEHILSVQAPPRRTLLELAELFVEEIVFVVVEK